MSTVVIIDLYCRMSFGDDGTVFKCEDQERQGRESVAAWARTQGPDVEVRIGKVLYDHALSAWKPKVVRPSFNEIMDRLETGVSQGVWVRDVDRFTRKMHEAVRIADVAKAGAVVLALRSEYDLATRKGRKRFLEDAMDAEDESSRISERSIDGFRNKALRGKSLATTRGFARDGLLPPPPGWEKGDPRERVSAGQLAREIAAVRDAAARILAGESSINQIAKEWNDAGLRTTRGGLWDAGIIRQMLEKPSLAGLAVHKGEVVGKIKGSEPVLDRETWDALQTHFSSRRRGRPATEYLLSGIAKCGRCGHPMYGRPTAPGQTYPDGSPRRQYSCQSRPNYPDRCGRTRMDQRLADEVIREAVHARLGDSRHADRLARRAARVDAERGKLLLELTRVEADADSLSEKTAEWGFERVDRAMKPLVTRITEIKQQLAALDTPDSDGAAALDTSVEWSRATLSQKRAMVQRAFPEGILIARSASTGRGASNDTERILFGQYTGQYPGMDREAS